VGFSMQGSGFRVQGSAVRVQGSGFRVQSSGCRVQGSGFGLYGAGCGVYDLTVAARASRRDARQQPSAQPITLLLCLGFTCGVQNGLIIKMAVL